MTPRSLLAALILPGVFGGMWLYLWWHSTTVRQKKAKQELKRRAKRNP